MGMAEVGSGHEGAENCAPPFALIRGSAGWSGSGTFLTYTRLDGTLRCNSAEMDRTDFVVGRIAQVGKIEFSRGPFAPAGRVLDALATVGNTGVMKSLDLFGASARKADGATISIRRRFPIDRPGDAE